jgi:ribosomal protein S27AE
MSEFHSLASSRVEPEPIACPNCGTIVISDAKNLMHMAILRSILCPKCNTIVIAANSYNQ